MVCGEESGEVVFRTVVADYYFCPFDAFEGEDAVFDLVKFDTESAEFYLVVDPAEELDFAVFVEAHRVSAVVSFYSVERKECCRSLFWKFDISASYAFAADNKLSAGVGRKDLSEAVKDIESAVRDRSADSDVFTAVKLFGTACNRTFSRAVTVHDMCSWRKFFKFVERFCRERLGSEKYRLEVSESASELRNIKIVHNK